MDDEEYFVDEIVDKRKVNGKIEYKVRWTGYDPCEATWEPIENLVNAQESIDEFEAKQKEFVGSSSELSEPRPKKKAPKKANLSISDSEESVELESDESSPRRVARKAKDESEEESEESDMLIVNNGDGADVEIGQIIKHKVEGKDLLLKVRLKSTDNDQLESTPYMNYKQVKKIAREKLIKYLEGAVQW